MPCRLTVVFLVFASVASLGCHRTSVPLPVVSGPSFGDNAADVGRGRYIVRDVAVCGGCHTPGRDPDGPLSGGTEFRDWRLGSVRAANLTPDSATGLGGWSDAEIVRALRNGEARDGRLLAPVMPYVWLHAMSDADALAVARYLKSLAPVKHQVTQRPSLFFRLGRLLFLSPESGTSANGPPRAPTPEYGGYLARHVGLCGECHTPRSGFRESADMKRVFAGDAHPPQGFPANPANLTPDSATGIGRWSEADFVRTIRTGITPRGDTLDPFMPWHQVRRMTDEDLQAIYRYLRTLPPIHNQVPRRARSVSAGRSSRGFPSR